MRVLHGFGMMFTLVFSIILAIPSMASENVPKISLHQAEDIGYKALNNPDIGLDGHADGEFYVFAVILFRPGVEGISGTVAVNARTGDVWDMVYCNRGKPVPVVSPAAKILQDDIRKKLRMSDREYNRLRRLHPPCLIW